MLNMLTYYPTYAILDEILSYSNYDSINFYFDLKNNLQAVYMKHSVINILESNFKSRFFDTSVFSSLISFLAFHRRYAIQRNININFYIFYEMGQSYYHQNINKKYKISRRINDFFDFSNEKREEYYEILGKNYELIDRAINRIPNCYVIKLNHFEADFVPYYLIKNNLVNTNNNVAQIIYSSDHDMMQCLTLDDVYIYQKIPVKKIKRIVKKNEVLTRELKKNSNIPDEYLPLAMAIIGDKSDDIIGIKGIGPVTFIKCFPELQKLIGSMDELYDNVQKNKNIFDLNKYNIINNNTKKIISSEQKTNIISNNLKMISFELISRMLNNPTKTEMLKRREYITDIINNKNTVNIVPLYESLKRVDVELEEYALELLFTNKKI